MNDTTIHLISGVEFDYANPDACEEIAIHDVAHALARITRFNGHVGGTWSVAQHTLLTAGIVRNHYEQPDLAFAALHHDDAEFVTFDWPTPLKNYVRNCGFDYAKLLERPVEFALARQLGLVVDDLHAGVVKDADDAAYEIEVSVLKPAGHQRRQHLDQDLMDYGKMLLAHLIMADVPETELTWLRAHAKWGGHVG